MNHVTAVGKVNGPGPTFFLNQREGRGIPGVFKAPGRYRWGVTRRLLLALGLALAIGLFLAPASAQNPTTCGAPGKPPCPLQHWMRVNAAAPLAMGELETLAKSFEAIEAKNPNPKGWANWSKMAREGATAAREGKAAAAKLQCSRCHHAYRRAYLLSYREREIE